MIWVALAAAIAAALGASGGKLSSALSEWLEEWRKHLKKHVKDDARRAAAMAIIDTETQHLDTFFVEVGTSLEELYLIHRDYHATLDAYTQNIDEVAASLATLQHAQVDAALAMRETLSNEEWTAIQAAIEEKLDKYWKQRRKAAEKADKKAAKQAAKQKK